MEHQKRRNSILKVRQHVEILDEINPNGAAEVTTATRRVSFHNVKHVQQYDREHGKIIDATPLKEKLNETVASDAILTPRGTNIALSNDTTSQNITHGSMDMSVEPAANENNETLKMFDITSDKTIHEKTVNPMDHVIREKTVTIHEHISGRVADETMALFNTTNYDEAEMSVDQSAVFAVPTVSTVNNKLNRTVPMEVFPSVNDTMAIFNSTNNGEADMSIDQSAVFVAPTLPVKPIADEPVIRAAPAADDTMALFNATNYGEAEMSLDQPFVADAPNAKINRTIPVESVDDKVEMLNQTNYDQAEMSMDESVVLAAPVPIMSRTVPMEITTDADETLVIPSAVVTAPTSISPARSTVSEEMDQSVPMEFSTMVDQSSIVVPVHSIVNEANDQSVPMESDSVVDKTITDEIPDSTSLKRSTINESVNNTISMGLSPAPNQSALVAGCTRLSKSIINESMHQTLPMESSTAISVEMSMDQSAVPTSPVQSPINRTAPIECNESPVELRRAQLKCDSTMNLFTMAHSNVSEINNTKIMDHSPVDETLVQMAEEEEDISEMHITSIGEQSKLVEMPTPVAKEVEEIKVPTFEERRKMRQEERQKMKLANAKKLEWFRENIELVMKLKKNRKDLQMKIEELEEKDAQLADERERGRSKQAANVKEILGSLSPLTMQDH